MANLSWISSNPDYINQMIRNTQVTLSNNYNDLDNIPIIKITSTTNNPQKVWGLKEGLYMIDGVVQVDNNTSYEVSNLLISMTARLENGKYILSAFIPYLRGLFEYILKTNSTEYEQHQKIVLMIKNDTLTLDNETIYTPIEDYHPATKKYVDDKANEVITELDRMGVNKENLESLNKENRIRDIKLQALLSETSDRNITIEEDTRYFDMPLSIDNGIVTINEMIGDTLVNVCDQEESVAITKSYTVENENHIALQGEYDGKCRPVLHGNTLVNHNADWDGNLQTGIETSASGTEDVQVEGIKGQEVSVVVEGNTVLNHALGKTSAVVSSIESENNGNYVDLTVANDMSSVVEIEGRTMVNVCDQKDPIAITKSYTVENSGNHIALQGEYDGSCRPVIQGNTLVNLFDYTKLTNFSNNGKQLEIIKNGIKLTLNEGYYYLGTSTMDYTNNMLKPNTTYTFLWNYKHISGNDNHKVSVGYATTTSSYAKEVTTQVNSSLGTLVFTTDLLGTDDYIGISFRFLRTSDVSSEITIGEYTNLMLFEGDLTQTPNLIPTEYVEGLKSSFEDTKLDCLTYESNIWIWVDIDFNRWQINAQALDLQGKFTLINYSDKNIKYELNTDIIGTDGKWLKEVIVAPKGIMLLDNPLLRTLQLLESDGWTQDNTSFESIVLLKGDWTSNPPTYEEVTNHAGKYKVEYKVTGKNKLDINKLNYTSLNVSIANNNIVISNSYTNHTYTTLRELGFKANTNYTISRKCDVTREDGETYVVGRISLATTNAAIRVLLEWDKNSQSVIFTEDELDYGLLFYGHSSKVVTFSDVQIEEGSEATSYEPYKSYTKTFYLNSPLLEGDTIEDVSGVATHVKRYEKVVLDGSSDEEWRIQDTYQGNNTVCFMYSNLPYSKKAGKLNFTNDRFINYENYPLQTEIFKEGFSINTAAEYGNFAYIRLDISRLSVLTLDNFKQWLQVNPTTVVYELASPIYEPISNESILCDSYVNGHLDFDSAVPIEKVEFRRPLLTLKYLKENTKYTIQFKSDNIGTSRIAIGGDLVYIGGSAQLDIVKGINKFEVDYTTGTNIALYFNGIGFNASNIVVTEAIDADFEYFEGLSSTYESCYPGGKNLFNGVWIIGEGIDASTGLPWISINRNRTDFIEIKPNTNYVASGASVTTSRFYDKNKQIIPNNVGINKSSPSNAKYLRISIDNTVDFSKFQIEEGSTATSYESFIDKYKVDVKVTGKNLIDKWVRGYINSANGVPDTTSPNSIRTDYIKLDSNLAYRINGLDIRYRSFLSFYDKDKKWLGRTSGTFTSSWDIYKGRSLGVYGILGDYEYLIVTHYDITEDVDTVIKNNTIQLEEGTVATSYEPYFESTKTFYLNSPLLEGDKIVTKNGKVYHYHKMDKVVLDGSEDWDTSNNLDKTCRFSIRLPIDSKGTMDTTDSIRGYSISNNFLCDYGTTYDKDKECYQIGWSTIGSIYIRIFKSKLSTLDVDGFKQWLSKNPTTVVYELASSYYELIDEYNNTILNIPKNVAHLTHTSAVPVNNTVFTNYKDELNILEANTQYRVMFDCDKASIPFTVTLGGTSQTVTSKVGTHSLLITTPSTLVDKNLVIDGIGRCGIDNIRIFKGNVEYDYVKGLWSGYEERKLENLAGNTVSGNISQYLTLVYHNGKLKKNTTYTIIVKNNSEDLLSFYTNEHIFKDYMSRRTNRDGNYIVFSNTTKNVDDFNAEGFNVILKADTNLVNVDFTCVMLEGDWTDNPPTYEEVMANEGKYAVKVKLDTNATIFGKGGRL